MRTFLLAVVLAGLASAQKMYVGAWPGRLLIIDEPSAQLAGEIPLKTGVARSLHLTRDRKRMVVTTVKDSGIEVVDLASKSVINSFTLTEGNKKFRLGGVTVDPDGKLLYATGKYITKQIDKFEIGKDSFLVADIAQQKVLRTVEIPKEESERLGRQLRLSPDGQFLYTFGQGVTVWNTTDFKVVEKIDLQKPPFPMMDQLFLGGDMDPMGDPGTLTSLFVSTDNIVRRSVFGITRFDLVKRTFDFSPIGPVPNNLSGLEVTPDRKTGYAISIEGQHGDRVTQFLVFDMMQKKLVKRSVFPGLTRFSFGITSTGRDLLIYGAGFTIDFYDAQTLQHKKTLDVNADMTTSLVVVPAS
jgi:hypothetical protein